MEFRATPEIRYALENARPVVALESTIVAHGFPAPDNLAVGTALEAAVREAGAVPATIAVIDGVPKIGLARPELERLAADPGLAKCSTRDIAALMTGRKSGATTVAATAYLAHAAGIRVFATGGIGGVHRGSGGDISADLVEIARSPVAVVSAGAKAILDLPATLEALETLNVPVVGFGCDEFPAFYSATSGLKLDHRFDEVGALAKMVDNHLRLARGGLLVCNPPPAEAALGRAEVEDLVALAIADARKAGIVGKAVTPYLLKTINALSGGRTLVCNKALAISNAGLGGRLAAALCA